MTGKAHYLHCLKKIESAAELERAEWSPEQEVFFCVLEVTVKDLANLTETRKIQLKRARALRFVQSTGLSICLDPIGIDADYARRILKQYNLLASKAQA